MGSVQGVISPNLTMRETGATELVVAALDFGGGMAQGQNGRGRHLGSGQGAEFPLTISGGEESANRWGERDQA